MPSIPFPLFTLSMLLILLLKVWLQPGEKPRGLMYFIAGCALLVLMSALRWAFDAILLRQLQSVLAILFPPLVWRCFSDLTAQKRSHYLLASFAPPAVALMLNLAMPAVTDAVLALLYLGYGIALLRTSLRGADAFVLARLTDSSITSSLAFAAGAFLCFSCLTDIAIAVDFSVYHGQHAALLVAISQGILLPFICLAILLTGRTASPVTDPALPESVPAESSEEETVLCQHLEQKVTTQALYLDPDLTLNLLARATGIPARQISRAVNRTHGCNVSQWINGFRIHHARRLLRQTDAPVTSIMLECGFATKSNFNREFVRLCGLSPTDFRRAAADSPAPQLKTE